MRSEMFCQWLEQQSNSIGMSIEEILDRADINFNLYRNWKKGKGINTPTIIKITKEISKHSKKTYRELILEAVLSEKDRTT